MLRPLTAAVLALLIAFPAYAAQGPAGDVVDRLHHTLIESMVQGDRLGYEGRQGLIAPVVEESFDLATMAEVVAARHWRNLSDAQRSELIDTFARMTVASFAARFDDYEGERFEIVDEAHAPEGRVMVRSRILRPGDEDVTLGYLLQADDDDSWRIVDILMDGKYSELATRRSEYGSVLNRAGFDGLIAALDKRITALELEAVS